MKSRWALTRKRKLSALAEDSGGSTSDAELEAAAIARYGQISVIKNL